jgi:ketosteroid isomerase-like protein
MPAAAKNRQRERRAYANQSHAMDELQTLLIRDACRHLLMQYATLLDAREMDAFVELFDDDLVWNRDDAAPLRSRTELRAHFAELFDKRRAANPRGHSKRHNFTTVCIEPIDAASAKSLAYALVYSDAKYAGELPMPMGDAELLVEYRHAFRKTARGWKIASHASRYVFRRG